MRISLASLLTAAAVVLTLAACGDDSGDGDPVDARRIDATVVDAPDEIDAPDIDAAVDARIDAPIDATPIDAPIDAPPTNSERIAIARATADGAGLTLPIIDATITYIKPALGTPANDPAGFTIQVLQAGPALMVAVDPTTLTPLPNVGDVVSFTITSMGTAGMQRRALTITGYTLTSTGADVGALAQNVTAATDLVTALDSYDSEVIDLSGTIATAFISAGNSFESAQITTTGIPAASASFLLRLPAAFRSANDVAMGCNFALNNTPVGRFNANTQLAAFVAADITLSNCPAPIVVAATALSATSVQVTFSRNVLASSVMTDGSQFTFDNGLTASAASVTGRTVLLTTSAQTNGTMYVVTVGTGITDLQGVALGTPNFTTFTAFTSPTHLVINEVDYNQTDTPDMASFVEIYNPTPGTLPLANLAITLLNGSNNLEYGTRIVLTTSGVTELPAGGYLVIRNATVTVPGGVPTIPVTGDFMQNGPDGIALINTSTNTLIDALSYGSGTPLTAVTIAGFTGTVSLVEGTVFTGLDTGDELNSLSRVPNGTDTNNAVSNWAVAPKTPGVSN